MPTIKSYLFYINNYKNKYVAHFLNIFFAFLFSRLKKILSLCTQQRFEISAT